MDATPSRPMGLSARQRLIVGLTVLVLLALMLAPAAFLRPPQRLDPGDGVGDPYLPNAGGAGYDALRYEIDVTWDEPASQLRGTTTIRARATADLAVLHVDLCLAIDEVSVDGRPAQVRAGDGPHRALLLDRVVRAGEELVAEVAYHGDPRRCRAVGGAPLAYQAGRELVVAGEPESAAAWFPSNDHPSDPALVDVRVRVPADLQAVSGGRLLSRDEDDDPATATWRWVHDEPSVTYAALLAIGQYTLEEGTSDGRPYVYAVSRRLPDAQEETAMAALRRTPERIRELVGIYGPYPLSSTGGLVAGTRLGFAGLETHGRPVYHASLARDAEWTPVLMTHELAHMWFGDSVTLRRWDDIVMNEGFATHAQWLVAERFRGGDADDLLRQGLAKDQKFWRASIADPSLSNLFGTTYDRGAMALEALRNVVGEEAFAGLAREWASRRGPYSYEDWRALAQQRTGRDLEAFFTAWYEASTRPPLVHAYGWPAA